MRLVDKYNEKLYGKLDDFKEETLQRHIDNKNASNLTNLNKALYALEYLAQLQKEGMRMVFKGGSAVQLLLPQGWQRLSIDLDITTDLHRDEIEDVLEGIYTRFGREYFSYERRQSDALGESLFCTYRIHIPTLGSGNSVILLDVVHVDAKYKTQKTRLKSFFYESDIRVETPTIDSITGDKLSTLGPHTIGRHLRDSRNGLEYIKHLYDIKNLILSLSDLGDVFNAYMKCHSLQGLLRDTQIEFKECLEDLFYVCKFLTLTDNTAAKYTAILGTNKTEPMEYYRICQRGSRRFQPFLTFNNRYTWESIRETAAAISFTAKLFELMENNEIEGKKATHSLKSLDVNMPELIKDEILIDQMIKEIASLPPEQRWHIHPEDIKDSPILLVFWYGHFYPYRLMELVE